MIDISEQETTKEPAVRQQSTARSTHPLLWEVCELGMLLIGFLVILLSLPVRYFYDGTTRFNALLALIQHGIVSNVSYSMVGPFFSLPLYELDRRIPLYGEAYWWQNHYNIFLLAAVFALTYAILRRRMDPVLLRRFFLIILVASMFGNSITFFGGETFTALGFGMGILVALLAWELVGWIAVVLGVVNTPAALVGLILAMLSYIFQKKRLRYCVVVIAAGALICAEAWIRRGSPLNNGYGNQAFSTPFLLGLISILFSFGKGLLFFVPGLLLPVKNAILTGKGEKRQELYTVYKLWLWFVVGLVLVYSSWWAWYGGWFWGPRFFVFASIPASFALAVRLRNPSTSLFANILTLLVLGYSFWVGLDGALFDQFDLSTICKANLEYLCHYNPQDSVLWRPFEVTLSLSRDQEMFLLFSLLVFAYLVTPLLLIIGKQILMYLQDLRHSVFKVNSWGI